MKRTWYLWLLVAAVAAAGLWGWSRRDDLRDRWVWSRFRSELTAENVTRMEFGGAGRPVEINPALKGELLKLLREGTFDRSNRKGEGPTPGAVLSLTFKDGKTVNVGMWSFQTFELSPRHLDPATHFLIKAEPLGVWLKNHFTGPNIGAGGS